MSVALEMKRSIVQLAGPRRDSDNHESMIARAAHRAGISFRTAKAFFYGETLDPRSSSVERVRAAIAKKTQGNRHDLLAIAADFTVLAERIARIDPGMAGPQADAMREIARRARALADGE